MATAHVILDPSSGYERIDERKLSEGTVVAWSSGELADLSWDNFLKDTAHGQFQQSTLWARAKHAEGWNPLRLLVTLKGEILAGFQILWQSSWRGRMGYISKGPIVLPGHCGLPEYVTGLIRRVAREKRLRGLVVQPPDSCIEISECLRNSGFLPEALLNVNNATWIIDLMRDFRVVEQEISKQTRKKVKQALNRGVTIREGGRGDLGTFFELMLSTCKRQRTAPVPSDLQLLEALWDAGQPGFIRLTFAECERRPLAGLITILFGRTVSLWKRGWSSLEAERHPNELLIYEALRWSNSNGYHLADFCALDIGIALNMLRGKPLTSDQERSRHTFHIRFGGSPRLLPEAEIYLPNPIVRGAYRLILRNKLQRAEEKREIARVARVPVTVDGRFD
jgi:hypothetical protein